MILAGNYIELRIYHSGKLKRYEVLELFKYNEGISYKIFYKGCYIFTLIPQKNDWPGFQMSARNNNSGTSIDWDLFSEIGVSLYSALLTETPS